MLPTSEPKLRLIRKVRLRLLTTVEEKLLEQVNAEIRAVRVREAAVELGRIGEASQKLYSERIAVDELATSETAVPENGTDEKTSAEGAIVKFEQLDLGLAEADFVKPHVIDDVAPRSILTF